MKTDAEKNARKQRRREQGPPQRVSILCAGSKQPTGHRRDEVICPECGRMWNVWPMVAIPVHSVPK